MSRHYRNIAGNLELFCGAYLAAFGTLAGIYFLHLRRPNVAMITGAAALTGILLVFRASRLLAWRRWLFWSVAIILIVVPIVWLLPPLLARK